MTPIEYALHLMVVVSVAWGAAATLASHHGGLWVVMGLFVLIGVIPVAALQITMLRGLLKDERFERLMVENRELRERCDENREENKALWAECRALRKMCEGTLGVPAATRHAKGE